MGADLSIYLWFSFHTTVGTLREVGSKTVEQDHLVGICTRTLLSLCYYYIMNLYIFQSKKKVRL